MIDGIIFALICGAMFLYFLGQFIDNWREIERDEMERQAEAKYNKEARYWKEQALRSRTVIKVMDGEKFSHENRR